MFLSRACHHHESIAFGYCYGFDVLIQPYAHDMSVICGGPIGLGGMAKLQEVGHWG